MRISFKRNGFIALASMLSFAVYAGDNLPLATAASGGYDKLKNESIDMKNILFIAFSSFILLFVSCTSEQETETYIPIDEIIPLDTYLIPNKDTKIVSTTLNFKDIDAIDYLLVRKSVGDSYSAKINQSELTSDYIFNYTIQKTDPQNFRLVLAAFYKDGNMSKELSLNVDNRWGFFIRNVTRIARVTGSIINGENFPSPLLSKEITP